MKNNSEGDLAVVLYSINGTTPGELNIRENEYLIVTNWNIGGRYAFGYKINDSQKKGKFPLPLVRKCTEKEVMEQNLSQYTFPTAFPINSIQPYHLQTNRISMVSPHLSDISVPTSPNVSPLIRQRPTAPPPDNRSSFLSEISSIPSSPSILSNQQRPTAPLDKSVILNRRKFENYRINPKQYRNFRDDI